MNSLGVKGIGEAGTIAATPAVAAAVLDAIRPLGVTELDMPLTPMRVWQAIQEGGARMITAPFDYEAPESLDEAIRMLHENGEDAKLLAGGHSLLPLMKVRLAAPTRAGRPAEGPRACTASSSENGGWRIGPMTRHADLQDTPELGVVARAASLIADQQVRNRGTIGGSLAHGDPASDLPAVLLALDGEVTARGPNGERTIAAADLFQDYLTTALAHDEVITEVRLPALEGYGFGYQKFTRRAEDWAMVGVCALVSRAADGTCDDVRIGLTNMGATPLRATRRRGRPARRPARRRARSPRAAEQAAEGTDPPGDLNATPDYKRHLARVLTRRALEEAVERLSLDSSRSRPGGAGAASATSPTAASPPPSTSRPRWSSRCCSRARPAWARPRWRRRSPGRRARA